MDWGRIKFFLGEVARSFTRNAGMQVTSVGTVAVTIVLLGAFLYVRAVVAQAGGDMLNQLSMSVYATQSATPAQVAALRDDFAKDTRIVSAQYIPKKQGLAEMAQRLKGQISLDLLTENPLPDKFRVQVRDAKMLAAVAAHIQKLPGVSYVDYGRDIVPKILALFEVVRRIGLALIALFVLVAGIIISNTIRLTVFARRREISIMQLVGATNLYIRAPFICEGMLSGLLGGLLAIGLLAAAQYAFAPQMEIVQTSVPLLRVHVDALLLTLELLAVGCLMGLVASWIAVGRYLRT